MKNDSIEIIKRNLSKYSFDINGECVFRIGNFKLFILLNDYDFLIRDVKSPLLNHETFQVFIYEVIGKKSKRLSNNHPIFLNYKPIQYENNPKFSDVFYNMPLVQLCELIKYLHRLTKLSAFT